MNVITAFIQLIAEVMVLGFYNDRYLQVVPWGFRKLLNWIAKEYNNPPVLIAENGYSDYGELNDRDRIDYHIVSGAICGLLSVGIKVHMSELIQKYSVSKYF